MNAYGYELRQYVILLVLKSRPVVAVPDLMVPKKACKDTVEILSFPVVGRCSLMLPWAERVPRYVIEESEMLLLSPHCS